MENSEIRLGFVSSYNGATGMASIYYPDRNGQVTAEIPVFSPFGLLQRLKKDEPVYVLHLSNNKATGVILGSYSTDGDVPAASLSTNNSTLTLSDSSGTATLGSILSRLAAAESRIKELEEKV